MKTLENRTKKGIRQSREVNQKKKLMCSSRFTLFRLFFFLSHAPNCFKGLFSLWYMHAHNYHWCGVSRWFDVHST